MNRYDISRTHLHIWWTIVKVYILRSHSIKKVCSLFLLHMGLKSKWNWILQDCSLSIILLSLVILGFILHHSLWWTPVVSYYFFVCDGWFILGWDVLCLCKQIFWQLQPKNDVGASRIVCQLSTRLYLCISGCCSLIIGFSSVVELALPLSVWIFLFQQILIAQFQL